jgi:branched-chain amino acid transport system permease protein
MDLSVLLQFAVSGVGVGCIYGLIGVGFCVIYRGSGVVNFAQGAFVMLGGVLTSVFVVAGVPYFLAAVCSVLAVALFGVSVYGLVVHPLWRRNAAIFVMILATLAVQIVIERVVLITAGDQPRTLPPFSSGPPIRLGSIVFDRQVIWIVVASLTSVACLAAFFRMTSMGRAMRACAVNQEAASLMGVPVSRMIAVSFAMSAALGAVAGILITPTQYTGYNIGVPFAINGFIAAIIGGFGSPLGAFMGGIILGVVQTVAVVVFGAGLKNVVALTVLLLFLFLRPGGLLGIHEDR